jgi:hypothetical protein
VRIKEEQGGVMLASRVLGAIKSIDPNIDRVSYLAASTDDLKAVLEFANSIASGTRPDLCDLDARHIVECVTCSLFGTRYSLGERFASWLHSSLLSVPARWPQRRVHGREPPLLDGQVHHLHHTPDRGWIR